MAIKAFGRFDGLYHVAGGSGRKMGDAPLDQDHSPVLEMLGIRVTALAGDGDNELVEGWNAGERAELQARIAAREPFLDFIFSRVNADGSQQQFLVSGEPMFSQSCRFIGYRGIGVEVTAHVIELGSRTAGHVHAS